MSSKQSLIAIVLPAYNEAPVIGSVLAQLPPHISSGKTDYQVRIVVVNDGSSDNTAGIVAKHKRITLINHILNSGAGAATRTGLNYAKKIKSDYVVTMDSDGQHSVDDVVKLAKAIVKDDADFIIGSRLLQTAGMPWYRILGNKGLSFITFLAFGVFVRDSQSGLRAYNKQALEKITFYSNEYAFCSEIIWSAHRNRLRIKEIPIQALYSDYSLAKGQKNWGVIPIIRHIIKRRVLGLFHG